MIMNSNTPLTPEEKIIKLPPSIIPIGVVMYYRNVSTGRPTRIHLLRDNGNSYCGFDDVGAEVVICDESDYIIPGQVCKKCLKLSRI
jgi:hypothetical protein